MKIANLSTLSTRPPRLVNTHFILLIFIFYFSYGRIEEDGSTNLDEEEENVDDFDTEPDMEVDDFDTEPDMEIEEVKFVNNLALCRSVVSETIDQLVARVGVSDDLDKNDDLMTPNHIIIIVFV